MRWGMLLLASILMVSGALEGRVSRGLGDKQKVKSHRPGRTPAPLRRSTVALSSDESIVREEEPRVSEKPAIVAGREFYDYGMELLSAPLLGKFSPEIAQARQELLLQREGSLASFPAYKKLVNDALSFHRSVLVKEWSAGADIEAALVENLKKAFPDRAAAYGAEFAQRVHNEMVWHAFDILTLIEPTDSRTYGQVFGMKAPDAQTISDATVLEQYRALYELPAVEMFERLGKYAQEGNKQVVVGAFRSMITYAGKSVDKGQRAFEKGYGIAEATKRTAQAFARDLEMATRHLSPEQGRVQIPSADRLDVKKVLAAYQSFVDTAATDIIIDIERKRTEAGQESFDLVVGGLKKWTTEYEKFAAIQAGEGAFQAYQLTHPAVIDPVTRSRVIADGLVTPEEMAVVTDATREKALQGMSPLTKLFIGIAGVVAAALIGKVIKDQVFDKKDAGVSEKKENMFTDFVDMLKGWFGDSTETAPAPSAPEKNQA